MTYPKPLRFHLPPKYVLLLPNTGFKDKCELEIIISSHFIIIVILCLHETTFPPRSLSHPLNQQGLAYVWCVTKVFWRWETVSVKTIFIFCTSGHKFNFLGSHIFLETEHIAFPSRIQVYGYTFVNLSNFFLAMWSKSLLLEHTFKTREIRTGFMKRTSEHLTQSIIKSNMNCVLEP